MCAYANKMYMQGYQHNVVGMQVDGSCIMFIPLFSVDNFVEKKNIMIIIAQCYGVTISQILWP